MKLILTQNITVTATPILIRREDSNHPAGDGIIPADVAVRKIVIEPVSASDTLIVRGINEASEWVSLRAGAGFEIDSIVGDDIIFGYVKSGGSVSCNLYGSGV
jgi:hypothetical protein